MGLASWVSWVAVASCCLPSPLQGRPDAAAAALGGDVRLLEKVLRGFDLFSQGDWAASGLDGKYQWVQDSSDKCKACHAPPCIGGTTSLPFTCIDGFRYEDPELHDWSAESACLALSRRGVKKVAFLGDSFVRHAYAAMKLILSGDYAMGANGGNPQCGGECPFSDHDAGCAERQGETWPCRVAAQLPLEGCNGNVHMDFIPFAFDWDESDLSPEQVNLFMSRFEGADAVVLGFGGHKGIGLNAAAMKQHFIDAVKNTVDAEIAMKMGGQMVWLSPHCGSAQGEPEYENGKQELQYRYAVDATRHLQDAFPGIRVVNSFTVTYTLADSSLGSQAGWQTAPDQQHWNRAINLIKASRLLQALTNGPV